MSAATLQLVWYFKGIEEGLLERLSEAVKHFGYAPGEKITYQARHVVVPYDDHHRYTVMVCPAVTSRALRGVWGCPPPPGTQRNMIGPQLWDHPDHIGITLITSPLILSYQLILAMLSHPQVRLNMVSSGAAVRGGKISTVGMFWGEDMIITSQVRRRSWSQMARARK